MDYYKSNPLLFAICFFLQYWFYGNGLGWVGLGFENFWWVGLGWVHQVMGWVGLGFKKWTHVHLWAFPPPLSASQNTTKCLKVKFEIYYE